MDTKKKNSRMHYEGYQYPKSRASSTILSQPIAILEGAIYRYLPNLTIKKIISNAIWTYEFFHRDVGEFGEITLRKIHNAKTELNFFQPELPPKMIFGPAHLRRLVEDFILRGRPLSDSARNIVEHSWNAQGRLYNDLRIWLSHILKEGGYLELPKSYQSGDSLYTPEELYNKRKAYYEWAISNLSEGMKRDGLLSDLSATRSKEDEPKTEQSVLEELIDESSIIFRDEQVMLDAACFAWVDRNEWSSITLEDFLKERFGENEFTEDPQMTKGRFYRNIHRLVEKGRIYKDGRRYRLVK